MKRVFVTASLSLGWIAIVVGQPNLTKAPFDTETLMTGTFPSPPQPADRRPFFDVQTGPIAIMELLNSVARAHGHAAWQVRHRCSPNDPRAIELQMLSYRLDEPGVAAACMNLGYGRLR